MNKTGGKKSYKNMKFLASRKGFTLIELLIVIAIIGLLASIVLVGFGSFRARGRDARRVADLRQTQNALELYYTQNNLYPDPSQTIDWDGFKTTLINAGIGVNALGSDPSPANPPYQYGSSPDFQNYVLAATLEDPNNPALTSDVNGDVFGINCDTPVYCVQF